MALPAPKLDDRTFQDIFDEARKRIPQYCRDWTDHNLSDPGITLIELFAWMTDTILYRLNQVPDLHVIKFLDFLGIRLREPVPARVRVTFWLSAPQPGPITLRAGTEVASTQTEVERSLVFTTDADLQVLPPTLGAVVTSVSAGGEQGRRYQEQSLSRLKAGFSGFQAFSPAPQVDDALYFGFENNLSQHIMHLDLECDSAYGRGVDPKRPPYVWEFSTGQPEKPWQACEVMLDTTKGMNTTGCIELHLPKIAKADINGQILYWVRVCITAISPEERRAGMRPYSESPQVRRVAASSWGGSVWATHSQQMPTEFLGRSDGTPGQRFHLQFTPVLKRQPGETVIVQSEGAPVQIWKEVTDFGDSEAEDRHFTLDSVTGELRLGSAVRQQDGKIRLYGAVPPRGANIVFNGYRIGGGQAGNVRAGFLNTLKTAIPYIAKVENREAAVGGLDAESVEAAIARAPAQLRARERAVTESDFECLAREALPALGRVKCLQSRALEGAKATPGQVYVLVIPHVENPVRLLQPAELRLKEDQTAQLIAYLDERRLLTTRLDVRPPELHGVAVKIRLRVIPGAERVAVEAEVLRRLYRFLNPLTGGPDGHGWPFGRELYLSDVYQCLQGIPQVMYIRTAEIFDAPPGGKARGEARQSIEVLIHGVIASGIHEVIFV